MSKEKDMGVPLFTSFSISSEKEFFTTKLRRKELFFLLIIKLSIIASAAKRLHEKTRLVKIIKNMFLDILLYVMGSIHI